MNNFLKNSRERCNKFRTTLLNISQKVSALHMGGSLSSVEILDVIYNYFLKKNDNFILSKGHTGIIQYIILNYKKIIPKSELDKYCTKNGTLGVHPKVTNPGIKASTGSLGHGLAIAVGFAIKNKNASNYILMSDGELMEGSVWESVLLASALKLKNIIIIIDFNGLQSSTFSKDTHPTLDPIKDKFISFGWESKVCKGHNVLQIKKAIENRSKKKPFALIAKTIKGYPISFMMNKAVWHYRSPDKDEYKKALKEINEK